MSNKKLYIKSEVIWSIVIPVLFLAILGLWFKFFSDNNAFPVDYDEIDPSEWSNKVFYLYIVFTGLCIIYHTIVVAFFGAKFNWNTQLAWIVYFAIAVVISLIAPIYMTFAYPEESSCELIMYLLFVGEYVVTFLVSTYLCPKHWDFCPFKK